MREMIIPWYGRGRKMHWLYATRAKKLTILKSARSLHAFLMTDASQALEQWADRLSLERIRVNAFGKQGGHS